jgi:hypothetical protein
LPVDQDGIQPYRSGGHRLIFSFVPGKREF